MDMYASPKKMTMMVYGWMFSFPFSPLLDPAERKHLQHKKRHNAEDGRRGVVDGKAHPRGNPPLPTAPLRRAQRDRAQDKVDHAGSHNSAGNKAVHVVPHRADLL